MNQLDESEVVAEIDTAFRSRGISFVRATVRSFPEEIIIVVEVLASSYDEAVRVAPAVERSLPEKRLIVVRKAPESEINTVGSVKSVNDPRISQLIELLNERSRTSERQASLHYIKDAAENLRVAMARRHHIVFGRRGVGKTALLVEAKHKIEEQGNLVIWANIQSLRGLNASKAFSTIVKRIGELAYQVHHMRERTPHSIKLAKEVFDRVDRVLDTNENDHENTYILVPMVQNLINRLCSENAAELYIFLDDFHYLNMDDQPVFMDLLHGATRDTTAWIKAAGIENQSRVFRPDPPVGMQIGHDALKISLDVTLEEPKKAREFLESILDTFLQELGISNRTGFLATHALDRLVLASAGVPRDLLLLCARAVQIARLRENARTVGIQDVNEAAGEAGSQKLLELEDDAASSAGKAQLRIKAMDIIRTQIIFEKKHTFFLINFRDKSDLPEEYMLLQSLADLRLIHLVKASLSDGENAGEKSEVYMIDLSEYSGSRLRKDVSVIDLQGDVLVLRKTGLQPTKTVADTSRKLVQIFRSGPEFKLQLLTPLLRNA